LFPVDDGDVLNLGFCFYKKSFAFANGSWVIEQARLDGDRSNVKKSVRSIRTEEGDK